MQKRKPHHTVIIRKSCLTGKAVWIYQGPASKKAEWMAYDRAKRQEVERIRRWGKTTERRKDNIARLLNDCMAAVPILDTLSPERKDAARRLLLLSKESVSCHRDFYNHISEERKRRNADKRIRKKMTLRRKEMEQQLC